MGVTKELASPIEHSPQIVLRAIHRAGQVAFYGAVEQIRLLDAAILTPLSRRNAILRHYKAD